MPSLRKRSDSPTTSNCASRVASSTPRSPAGTSIGSVVIPILGPDVNSAVAETRPSLSWDATTLYFGSTKPGGEGSSDHYVTTRERLNGN
jgi:hypothetical protein